MTIASNEKATILVKGFNASSLGNRLIRVNSFVIHLRDLGGEDPKSPSIPIFEKDSTLHDLLK